MIEAANTSGGSPVAAPDDGSQGMGAFEGRSSLKTWIFRILIMSPTLRNSSK
jgi:hypothetical protein